MGCCICKAARSPIFPIVQASWNFCKAVGLSPVFTFSRICPAPQSKMIRPKWRRPRSDLKLARLACCLWLARECRRWAKCSAKNSPPTFWRLSWLPGLYRWQALTSGLVGDGLRSRQWAFSPGCQSPRPMEFGTGSRTTLFMRSFCARSSNGRLRDLQLQRSHAGQRSFPQRRKDNGNSRLKKMIRFVATIFLLLASTITGWAAEPIRILFLGDNGHHQPAARFAQLAPVLKERGIDLTYSDKVDDLNPATLRKFDGLVIYANTTRITPEQEQALLDYVAGGKGLIPLHCASYCFLNSPKYIDLVGAQFQRHGTGTFRTILSEAEHPIMRGFGGFESWDETYVHTKHNDKDRTVLEYRQEGDRREPWTWVRTHGKGRVFYTAWGHDQRTWGNPGFQNLVERGIRWAVGADPGVVPAFTAAAQADSEKKDVLSPDYQPPLTAKRTDAAPFEFTEAKVPFYPPGRRTSGDGEWNKMQQPLTVEESMKHFLTPAGFEVKLFIAEPQLEGKPIYMTWDERGRLWVCETYDYPNELQPVGEGRDKIRICEDTDGDGRADKFTVFAEKLSIPTTI